MCCADLRSTTPPSSLSTPSALFPIAAAPFRWCRRTPTTTNTERNLQRFHNLAVLREPLRGSNTRRKYPKMIRTTTLLSLTLATALAAATATTNGYVVHNLVSDLPGLADHVDPNLIDPWGVAFSATSPFWVGNNHSGTSTLYDGTGTAVSLVVAVPTPAGPNTKGAITG